MFKLITLTSGEMDAMEAWSLCLHSAGRKKTERKRLVERRKEMVEIKDKEWVRNVCLKVRV